LARDDSLTPLDISIDNAPDILDTATSITGTLAAEWRTEMSTSVETPQVGEIEQRGIDLVPAEERHGRPRDLFFMWFGTNTNVFYIINGAILISIGLNFVQSVVIILLGNLAFFLVGLTSLQGPRTGTATFAINRAPFGIHGGRAVAFFNWLTVLGFEGSGVALAVIALLTVTNTWGWSISGDAWFKVVIIVLVAGVQLLTPLFGHATIMAVQKFFAWVFAAFFVILAILMSGKMDLSAAHPANLAGLTLGFALMVSAGGLSWANTGSDYSRYLARESDPRAIFWWASWGGYIPAVLLEVLGAAVATHFPSASDPISGLPSALPGWFVSIYLLILTVNLLAVNGIDLYSSGLTLQTMGLRIKRIFTTSIDMVVAGVLAAIAVFSSDFNTLYGEFLGLLIVFLAPWVAIYLVDAWYRRDRYDPIGLLRAAGGPYWYQGGINWRGIISLAIGMVAAALWLNSSLLQGPLSRLFGDSDMSVFTGILGAGLAYFLLAHDVAPFSGPAETAEEPPVVASGAVGSAS
jgi:nucleobase:cation symporter-1, NCS1 family